MLRNRRGFARIKATILLAILIVVLAVVGVTFLKNRQNTVILTSSTLEKVVAVSDVNVTRFPYEGVADIKNKDGKHLYYVKYAATVTASADMSKMTFDIDNEAKTVHPILPEIQIKQPVLDEKQFSFMPDDANIDLKTVIKTCKVDVVKEVKADKNLYSVAEDNLKQAVTGLIMPIAEAEDYEIVWE